MYVGLCFEFALKWNNIFCNLAILRFCYNLLHTLWALMLLLKGVTECVNEQALAFLKGSLYWFLLMNYPKCRRAVVAGVQSKNPISACKYIFKSWHTEPWCSSPSSPLPKVRWEGESYPANITYGEQYLLLQKVPLESKGTFAEQAVH